MSCDYQLIETFEELEKISNLFNKEKAIAVDLEADSMYHFKEKVCLIQIATCDINVVIDPLKASDLSPLRPIFKIPVLKKYFMELTTMFAACIGILKLTLIIFLILNSPLCFLGIAKPD